MDGHEQQVSAQRAVQVFHTSSVCSAAPWHLLLCGLVVVRQTLLWTLALGLGRHHATGAAPTGAAPAR